MDKVTINNQIVLMRKFVKQAKIRAINNYTKEIRLLQNRKGNENEASKHKRKADRLLSKVAILSKIQPDSVSRKALSKEKDWKAVLKEKNIPLEEQCYAMLANYKPVQDEVEKFHKKYWDLAPKIANLVKNWEEENPLTKQEKKKARQLRKNIKKIKLENNNRNAMPVGSEIEKANGIKNVSNDQASLNVLETDINTTVSNESSSNTNVQSKNKHIQNDATQSLLTQAIDRNEMESSEDENEEFKADEGENSEDEKVQVNKVRKETSFNKLKQTDTEEKDASDNENDQIDTDKNLTSNSENEQEDESKIVLKKNTVKKKLLQRKTKLEASALTTKTDAFFDQDLDKYPHINENELQENADSDKDSMEESENEIDEEEGSEDESGVSDFASETSPEASKEFKSEKLPVQKSKQNSKAPGKPLGIQERLKAIADNKPKANENQKSNIKVKENSRPKSESNKLKAVTMLNLNELQDLEEIPIDQVNVTEEVESNKRKKDPFFLGRRGEIQSDSDNEDSDNPGQDNNSPVFEKNRFARRSTGNDFSRTKRNFRDNSSQNYSSGFRDNSFQKNKRNTFEDRRNSSHTRDMDTRNKRNFEFNKDKEFKPNQFRNSRETKSFGGRSTKRQDFHQQKSNKEHFLKNKPSFSPNKSTSDDKPLHPSWEAKRKLKEAAKTKFQGKRIVFGN